MSGWSCVWPGCRQRHRHLEWCYQHWPALGEELQARLTRAWGTIEYDAARVQAHDQALASIEWVKHNVTGGSHAHSDSSGE
jgi:hypothetical protein